MMSICFLSGLTGTLMTGLTSMYFQIKHVFKWQILLNTINLKKMSESVNNITSKDIIELKTLLNEINNLLNRIAPKNNRFQSSDRTENKYRTEYLTASTVCNMLNVDMHRLTELLTAEQIEHRFTRTGILEIKKDSVLEYIAVQRDDL